MILLERTFLREVAKVEWGLKIEDKVPMLISDSEGPFVGIRRMPLIGEKPL